MKIRRSVWLSVGMLVVLAGCTQQAEEKKTEDKKTEAKAAKPQLILRYTKMGSIAPLVHAGDVIEFEVPARWDPKNQSPCSNQVGDDTTHCEIDAKAAGKTYTFRCPYQGCDPEIMVDDGTRNPPFALKTGPEVKDGTNVRVRMVCDVGTTGSQTYAMKREPEGDIVAGPGKVVLFGVTGNYSEWHLDFNPGEQGYMCQETDPINSDQDKNKCTVKSSGPRPAHFKIVISGCDNASDAITMKPS